MDDPMRAIRGDNMPEGPRQQMERDQANEICRQLDEAAMELILIHERIDRIRMMVKRYAME